jgi:hypothetical protein
LVDGGQVVSCRKPNDLLATRVEVRVCRDKQRANALACERHERGLEFLVSADIRDSDALVDAARRLLDLLQLHRGLRKVRVEQNADQRHTGHELAQKPEPLRLHEICQQRDAGCISTGAAEALDQSEPDWVAAHSEHDGNSRCCPLAASADGSPPAVVSTATPRLTNSAAMAGRRSYRPRAQRNSIARF